MKIYVAGKFEQKEEIRSIYKKLQEMGHEISYDWTVHQSVKNYQPGQDSAMIGLNQTSINVDLARQYTQNELKAIAESDIFIYLTQELGTTNKMEFGAALMQSFLNNKLKIFAVGKANDKSNWFFMENVRRRDSVEEVLEEIGEKVKS